MQRELALQDFGLSQKETQIYLLLLPLGIVNLQEIAKRIDFPRTTVYNTLNYLVQKGLVSKIIKEGVTFFQATDPQKLVDTLAQRKKLVESILPELVELRKAVKESSHAEIYEGNKGLFTVLSDVFKVNQELHYFGSYSLSLEVLKHQPEHFRTVRLERKIPARIVIEPYDEPVFHSKEYQKITEMRFVKDLKDFPCMIFIYGEKVALYTLRGDLIGIIIQNKEVAKAMKMVFEMYWLLGKPS